MFYDTTLQVIVTFIQSIPGLVILIMLSFKFGHNPSNDCFAIGKETIINCTILLTNWFVFWILDVILPLLLFNHDYNVIYASIRETFVSSNWDIWFFFIYVILYCIFIFGQYFVMTGFVLHEKNKFKDLTGIQFAGDSISTDDVRYREDSKSKTESQRVNRAASGLSLTKTSESNENSSALHSVKTGYKFTLTEILSDEIGFRLFADFCVKEFSVESLLFLFHLSQIKHLIKINKYVIYIHFFVYILLLFFFLTAEVVIEMYTCYFLIFFLFPDLYQVTIPFFPGQIIVCTREYTVRDSGIKPMY